MKLSISLPDQVAKEIKKLAKDSERSTSWWIQRAWALARVHLHNPDEAQKAKVLAMDKIESLKGSLKADFPQLSSVSLAKQAFKKKR